MQSGGCSQSGGQNWSTAVDIPGVINFSGFGAEALDIESPSYVARGAIGPAAVQIDVLLQMLVLGKQFLQRAVGIDGVIATLDGIAKNDHKPDGGVKSAKQIEVTGGEFVHFVENDARGTTGKAGLPGADAPAFILRHSEGSFPVFTKVVVGYGDAQMTHPLGATEKFDEWGRFATAGKTSQVSHSDLTRSSQFSDSVKSVKEFRIAGRKQHLAEHPVKLVLEVGSETLGS